MVGQSMACNLCVLIVSFCIDVALVSVLGISFSHWDEQLCTHTVCISPALLLHQTGKLSHITLLLHVLQLEELPVARLLAEQCR
jgi:hypothetical protein